MYSYCYANFMHVLEGKIFIPQQLQDLTQVIPLYSQLIVKGNRIYSLFHVPVQQPNVEVKEVLQYNNEEFQKIELIADLGFFTVEDLESYLARYHWQHPKFTADCAPRQDDGVMLQGCKYLLL